jgi:hypothetical protein
MNYIVLVIFLLPISVVAFSLITFDVDGTLVQGSGQAAAQSAHAKGNRRTETVFVGMPIVNALFLLKTRFFGLFVSMKHFLLLLVESLVMDCL